jgi:hypothetical protein
MVGMDTNEENMNIEIEVADSGNGDEQEYYPIDDGHKKDHQRRHAPAQMEVSGHC